MTKEAATTGERPGAGSRFAAGGFTTPARWATTGKRPGAGSRAASRTGHSGTQAAG